MSRVLVFSLLFAVSWVGRVDAAPEKKAIYSVVTGFFGCLMDKSCKGQAFVHGKDAEKNLQKIQKRQENGGMKLVVAYMTSGIMSKKYMRTKTKLQADLQKAGYDVSELPQLGQEKAIVQLGPNVAMASSAVMILRNKEGGGRRVKVEHFYVILWKLPEVGWRVVFLEDFPARWMAKNKPSKM
ncbi:MAG: hypothetical protein H6728_11240 [Myxococcales bacterium]|nr:hypothetical protein [Myxococcales bacterium]MCB9643636.1 hypothetical protein [Myxococcales bacterium]